MPFVDTFIYKRTYKNLSFKIRLPSKSNNKNNSYLKEKIFKSLLPLFSDDRFFQAIDKLRDMELIQKIYLYIDMDTVNGSERTYDLGFSQTMDRLSDDEGSMDVNEINLLNIMLYDFNFDCFLYYNRVTERYSIEFICHELYMDMENYIKTLLTNSLEMLYSYILQPINSVSDLDSLLRFDNEEILILFRNFVISNLYAKPDSEEISIDNVNDNEDVLENKVCIFYDDKSIYDQIGENLKLESLDGIKTIFFNTSHRVLRCPKRNLEILINQKTMSNPLFLNIYEGIINKFFELYDVLDKSELECDKKTVIRMRDFGLYSSSQDDIIKDSYDPGYYFILDNRIVLSITKEISYLLLDNDVLNNVIDKFI